MRLNNKGFAISSMMYSILLLFLMLILGVLGILGSRKIILDKVKNEIITELTQNQAYAFSFEHKDILLANTSKVNNFTFSLLDGVKILDQNGNVINTPITVESAPEFNSSINGTYIVTYTALYEGYPITAERKIEVIDPIVYDYAYTGDEQVFETPINGVYRMELWGASGGDMAPYIGGKGAYTVGDIALKYSEMLYVYVGGKGSDSTDDGGYNGGGSLTSGQNAYGRAGGGATDIRLNNSGVDQFESLKSRIMVAAGGGGANLRSDNYGEGNGGAGGTLVGLNGESTNYSNGYGHGIGTGASQIVGGITNWTQGTGSMSQFVSGTFGHGSGTEIDGFAQSGGGSGYYGGGASSHGGAGGGSSYISGHEGCNAIAEDSTSNQIIHTDQSIHYSNKKFINTNMKSGIEAMPTYDGASTMVGNSGNGYAKITMLIIENGKIAKNLVQNSGFEQDSDNWVLSNARVVNTHLKNGSAALELDANITAMSSQALSNPIAGHIYYGSIEFLSTSSFTASDSRFEWYLTDAVNSMMVFAMKNVANTSWQKLSSINSLSTPNEGNWIIRNFVVNGTAKSYVDNLMILDLTEIYGAGNEPPKEWCDSNIRYFDGIGIVPNY